MGIRDYVSEDYEWLWVRGGRDSREFIGTDIAQIFHSYPHPKIGSLAINAV